MSKGNTVKVWDISIRIFHWSLVISFFVAYITAEEADLLHIYSGYAVLTLVSYRLLWGFVGTKYARFRSFIFSPGEVLQYIKSLAQGHPRYYIGHNPAGGLMVLALLTCLLIVTISGLKLYAVEEGLGPLASVTTNLSVVSNAYSDDDEHEKSHRNEDGDQEEFWEEIHELSTDVTLFLIFLHIAGVFMTSKLHHENLPKAMITGRKQAP